MQFGLGFLATDKARYVAGALSRVRGDLRGFDLRHLAAIPLGEALAFLERLEGVARKVSASTRNASTLALPVMIVDTHVLRVLVRLGAVRPRADYREASETITAAVPGWSGADFLAFHVGLKRLGQTLCLPEVPACGACPLATAGCRLATTAPPAGVTAPAGTAPRPLP